MNKKGKINKAMVIGFLIIALVIIAVYGDFVISNINYDSDIRYELPDGVVCERWSGNFRNIKFGRCSDGKIHQNPESYKKVRIK